MLTFYPSHLGDASKAHFSVKQKSDGDGKRICRYQSIYFLLSFKKPILHWKTLKTNYVSNQTLYKHLAHWTLAYQSMTTSLFAVNHDWKAVPHCSCRPYKVHLDRKWVRKAKLFHGPSHSQIPRCYRSGRSKKMLRLSDRSGILRIMCWRAGPSCLIVRGNKANKSSDNSLSNGLVFLLLLEKASGCLRRENGVFS